MAQTSLSIESIIAALKASLDNFVVEPLKSAPAKGAKGVYYKTKIIVNGSRHAIRFVIDKTMILGRGAVNPDNANDVRNQYANEEKKTKEHKLQFALDDPQLVELFTLLQNAYYHALQKSWASGIELMPGNPGRRAVHSIIDFCKMDYDNLVNGFATEKPDTKFAKPYVTFRAKVEKRPADHKVEAWRNTPESMILDSTTPKRNAAGNIVGFLLAKINDNDINYANAHRFLTDKSEFLRTTITMGDISYTGTWITSPLIIQSAIVKKGEQQTDESEEYGKYYTGAAAPAVKPTPVPAPAPQTDTPADVDPLKIDDALVDDLLG